MKSIIGLLAFYSIINFAACQDQAEKENVIKILFVGNSLTYTNNLPALVAEKALTKGMHVQPEMLAFPNYALEDHWNDGRLQHLINNNTFTFVIIQQGPSSQADGRMMLSDYGTKISNLCKKRGAKLVFFMVWPAKSNLHSFDGVIANYTNAAVETQSILCRVGELWKNHFDATGDFSYYGPDEFHPSLKGSSRAAEIIVDTLFKK
jgi:hypothetical protein